MTQTAVASNCAILFCFVGVEWSSHYGDYAVDFTCAIISHRNIGGTFLFSEHSSFIRS